MLNRENLHEYQNLMISKIKQNKSFALFVDMGLGKTVSTLTAIKDLYDSCEIEKILIIAPLRVAKTVWHTEISNWSHLSGLTYSIIHGSQKEREIALNKDCQLYIINRENTDWLVEKVQKSKKLYFDMLIIDESSSFKSHSSKRFKYLKKLLNVFDRKLILTGTPSPNGYMDLWSQIYILDQGERLGKNITMYRQSFFDQDYMSYSYTIKDKAEDKIKRRLKDICLSIRSDDAIDLPDFVSTVVKCDMSNELLKKYKEFENDFILQIKDHEITAFNAGAMSNKLLQFCSGAIYTENDSYIEIHDLKIEALKEIIENNPDENFLIAYNFKHEKDRLLREFKEAKLLDTNPKIIEDWNAKKIKILLAHPASCGHGLNLQKGGKVLIWFGFQWSLELYQQFNKRLHRQGQTERVRCFHIAVGDIEYRLLRALEDKDLVQEDLLNNLRGDL